MADEQAEIAHAAERIDRPAAGPDAVLVDNRARAHVEDRWAVDRYAPASCGINSLLEMAGEPSRSRISRMTRRRRSRAGRNAQSEHKSQPRGNQCLSSAHRYPLPRVVPRVFPRSMTAKRPAHVDRWRCFP